MNNLNIKTMKTIKHTDNNGRTSTYNDIVEGKFNETYGCMLYRSASWMDGQERQLCRFRRRTRISESDGIRAF